MIVNSTINRVATMLERWQLREKRLSTLFPNGLSSSEGWLKAQLVDYEKTTFKYRVPANLEESVSLQILKDERRRIEKLLYPKRFGFLIILWRRLFVVPVQQRLNAARELKQEIVNGQSLHTEMQKAGFYGLEKQLKTLLDKNDPQFNIPVSYYLNERERIDQELSFVIDNNGIHHFEGYRSCLVNEQKPSESKEHFFSSTSAQMIRAEEAVNLLAGRSIKKDNAWHQFDLNDKNSDGNYRMKSFPDALGFDLDRVIGSLPVKLKGTSDELQKVKSNLRLGNRETVSCIIDGTERILSVEASPQFQTVQFFDGNRKISIADAFASKERNDMQKEVKIDSKKSANITSELAQTGKNGKRMSN